MTTLICCKFTHFHLSILGETACFACAPPLVVASHIDERTLKREGVCAASLPTTMGMVAGMLVQNTLKYLLKFGKVSLYLGYSALEDFFPTWEMRPNEQCDDSYCLQRQLEFKKNPIATTVNFIIKDKLSDAPVHEDDFGIEVVAETAAADLQDNTKVTEGLRSAYVMDDKELGADQGNHVADSGESLEELMAKMNKL